MEIGKKATNEDRSHSLHLKLIVFAGLLLLQIVLFVLAARYVRDYFGFVLAIIPILEFIVFIYIFNDSSNPMYKLAWVFLILTIPFFGILIYLFVAFNVKQKAMHQRFSTMANRYGPLYDKISNEGVHRDLKEEDGLASLTSSYLKNTGDFPVFKAQGVDYHNDGRIHFDDMLVELEKAEKFIFMEYFILADGLMWQSILDILKKKVKEGVEVRLLLDGMMAFINLPRDFVEEMEGYGIKARLFNVMRVNLSVHQNHRDHRKIMVIDGEVAYTGGLNIADEYINEKKRFGYWKDTAVKIQGDAVDSFTVMFLEVWNVLEGGHLEERYLRESKSSLAKDGFVIPYYDTPYNGEEIGKKSIWI
ncbi:MAG TPA: phospholipase D-like domain-containing protein, partial [Clostridia bacterium]|nr:phospholipase D-like domain-containing protein [Clostridia bacterium]